VTDTVATTTEQRGAPPARPARGRSRAAWLGVLPFFAFVAAFLLLPIIFLVIGSITNDKGELTIDNYLHLSTPTVARAYGFSIEISAVTAIAGGILGLLLAYAVILGGLPKRLRSAVMTFSGVASNFAGIPLAIAFIFTLGQLGVVTVLLKNTFGLDIWDRNGVGFNLYSKFGLELVYLYFQFPLMVLIMAPAIDGLKKEWREAAENMGASSFEYWRRVAFPVLLPSIMGCVILLFGNAFGAQATAYQLTSGQIPLVTVLIGIQMSGDVLHDPNLAYALAMGMVFIMAISIAIYTVLQRRTEMWLK
jgi:putative spermidine/putrescine transport system permease protein